MKKLLVVIALFVLLAVQVNADKLIGGFNGSLDGWYGYSKYLVSSATLAGKTLSPTESTGFYFSNAVDTLEYYPGLITDEKYLSFDYATGDANLGFLTIKNSAEPTPLLFSYLPLANTNGTWQHMIIDISSFKGISSCIIAFDEIYALDNVRLSAPSAVPEPATLVGLLAFIPVGLMLLKRK